MKVEGPSPAGYITMFKSFAGHLVLYVFPYQDVECILISCLTIPTNATRSEILLLKGGSFARCLYEEDRQTRIHLKKCVHIFEKFACIGG